MSNQFIRKCGLIVYASNFGAGAPSSSSPPETGAPLSIAPAAPGIDLSAFRIQFQVKAMDIGLPPTAVIRVYNLADTTVQQIQNEFQSVSLQAGYQNGNYGVIFQGSIVRFRKGRLSNIDTFVDIMASNMDALY